MDQDVFVDLGDFDHKQVCLDEPPQTAEHYLRQVMVSRSRCAEVVSVELDQSKLATSPFGRHQTVLVRQEQPAPSTAAPPLDWQEKQCADFSQLRSRLVVLRAQMKERMQGRVETRWNLPNSVSKDCTTILLTKCMITEQRKWLEVVLLKKPSAQLETLNANVEHHEGTPPLLALVLSLTTPQINQLFGFQVEWFLSDGYSVALMQWLFALAAVLEKPLDPDVCASLRDLARQCRQLRSTLSADDRLSREFSFFIAIVAIYFAQRDLAD